MADAFAQAGMKVMIADIEDRGAGRRRRKPAEDRADIGGTDCDVTDAASVERAAQATFDRFGNVHVVCNNAGVAAGGGIDHISLDNWRWVIDVNLMGVLHGIRSFLPHIRAHGEGGHIVNTASMAGMQGGLGFSPYGASKFAVVSMSEGLHIQLKPHGIGVSVLCPSYVRTRMARADATARSATARRSRSIRRARRRRWSPKSPEICRQGSIPPTSPRACSAAVRDDRLYVFTHPGMRAEVEDRFAAILAAMDGYGPIIRRPNPTARNPPPQGCSRGQNDAREASRAGIPRREPGFSRGTVFTWIWTH